MGFRWEHRPKINCPQAHAFTLLFRQLSKFFRGINPFDFSFFQINNSVGQFHQVVQPVFCYQNRFALLFYQPQMLSQLLNGSHIQIGGRFIQQINLWVHGINRSEGDFLLFTAGQLKNIPVPQLLNTQIVGCLFHSLYQLLWRTSLVLNSKGNLAVCINIEKLRPWILENGANLSGNLIHRDIADFLTIYQHTAMKLSLIKLRYQSIHQPCNRCFSAPAAATEQDAFSVRNFQIDVMQPTMFLPRIGKRYIFKLNQPITPPRTHNSKIR